MAIIASNKGGGSSNYAPIPAGNYIARCYQMIELGTTRETILGNEKDLHKIRLTFELPTEVKVFNEEKGEQPLVISKEFTLSMNEKASLRIFLKSWRGKDFTEDEAKAFDVTKLLGVPCLLNIIHKTGKKDPSKVYDEVASVSPMPKGMICPVQVNPSVEFSISEWNQGIFNALPEFLQNKIMASHEYKARTNQREVSGPPTYAAPAPPDETFDDGDLPF